MALTATYLAIAVLLAPALFAVAEWRGEHHLRHRWLYALLAGLMWPVLVVGGLQFAAVVGLRRAMHADSLERDFSTPDSGEAEVPSLPIPYVPIGRPA